MCIIIDNNKHKHRKEVNMNTARVLDHTADIIEFPTPQKKVGNKKKGTKSEVMPFEVEDIKKVLAYFKENEKWTHYLLFTIGCNMARRVGDTLNLTWEHIFNPETGKFRSDILEIVEDKTDKLANPKINQAVRDAVMLYIEKTECDVSANGYKNPVFLQLSGTHKGKVISSDGYLKGIKKAAKAVGIEYNVGTHSPRKTFGMVSRMLHPNDYDSMELLQTIYNHSDTKTTKHYIGLTKKKVDQYYDDMGTFFGEYITGDKQYNKAMDKPTITLEWADLRDVLCTLTQNVDELTAAIDLLEQLAK